jgi:hypothetical protein
LGPTKSWKYLRGRRRVWVTAKRFDILERPNRKTLETENGRWISVFLFKQEMKIYKTLFLALKANRKYLCSLFVMPLFIFNLILHICSSEFFSD